MPCQQESISLGVPDEENGAQKSIPKLPVDSLPIFIFPIAGETAEKLEENLENFIKYLKQNPKVNLADLAYTLGSTGNNLDSQYRIAVVGKDAEDILDKLENDEFLRGNTATSQRQKVCFVFPGIGSGYHGMGRALYETSPVFKSSFDEMDFHMKNKKAIFGEDKELIKLAGYCGPTIFQVSHNLTKLWESWGVTPDMILPHSYGEMSAAYCAEIINFQEVMKSLQVGKDGFYSKVPPGRMLCLFKDDKQTSELMEVFLSTPENKDLWIDIAVMNSNRQTVVGGTSETIQLFAKFCENNGIHTVNVPVIQAYHTRLMDECLDELKQGVAQLGHGKPNCDYFSSVTGRKFDHEDPSIKNYWIDHTRRTVRFTEAAKLAYESGARIFLEIGGHPTISPVVMQNIEDIDGAEEVICLPSMHKRKENWDVILDSLAELWTKGYPVKWKGFYEHYEGNLVNLPVTSDSAKITSATINSKSVTSFWESLGATSDAQDQIDLIASHLAREVKIVLKLPRRKEVTASDDLKELGMDSMKAILLKAKLQKMVGSKVSISVNDMFGCHTVEDMAKRVHKLIFKNADEDKKKEKIEWLELIKKDAVLWSHIKTEGNQPPVELDNVENILLTGATGNLAPYILEWLTKNRSQTKTIYCLIRNGKGVENTAEKRLENHLKNFGMFEKIDMTKVKVVAGDLPKQYFGMGENVYEKLAGEVDAVINCAVSANHLAQYKMEDLKYGGVRAVNVIGAQRVFEFASQTKTKWVYHGTTLMAMPQLLLEEETTDGKMEEMFSDVQKLHEGVPNAGYGISKAISDDLANQAIQRGIPVKAFMFPKIFGDTLTGRQTVMENHFFVKFIYYVISGRMPDLDVPLLLLPVDTAADITMRVFFNNASKPDMYYVANPHYGEESELSELVEEFGPQLRILLEIAKVVEKEGEDAAKQQVRKMICSAGSSLAKMVEEKDAEDPNWMDDTGKVFADPRISTILRQVYGYRMKLVSYDDFVDKLVKEGEDSLLFNWIEFYTNEDSPFKLAADGKFGIYEKWKKSDREQFGSGLKIEKLYPNLKEIIEHPMITVRRDFQYTIRNAREIFMGQKHLLNL